MWRSKSSYELRDQQLRANGGPLGLPVQHDQKFARNRGPGIRAVPERKLRLTMTARFIRAPTRSSGPDVATKPGRATLQAGNGRPFIPSRREPRGETSWPMAKVGREDKTVSLPTAFDGFLGWPTRNLVAPLPRGVRRCLPANRPPLPPAAGRRSVVSAAGNCLSR